MIFVIPKIFIQSDIVLWDVMIEMSSLLEVLTMSDMFEFLIYILKKFGFNSGYSLKEIR